MTRFLFLFLLALSFSQCKTFFHSGSKDDGKYNTVKKRVNGFDDFASDKAKSADTFAPVGPRYIPLFGKREAGINPEIAGAWELESLDGYTPKGDVIKKLDSIAASKLKLKDSKGEDIVYNTDPKLTPGQGSSYHIPEKPCISFYGANETFSGFSGCNRYSGRYEMSDSNSITLKSAAASTRMVCIGDYDENPFLEALHKVSKFRSTDEQLELMDGDKVILTFTRKKE